MSMDRVGTVSQIWRYPVSSTGGEPLESAALDGQGIAGDRLWGLADLQSGGVARPTDRRWRGAPEVASRTVSERLEICVPGEDWLPADGRGAQAALTRHFGFPVGVRRLVPFGTEGSPSAVPPRYARADLHLLTTASMDALRALLPPGSLVDVRRFRPNLVIHAKDGVTGLVESEWVGRDLRIGRAIVRIVEPCSRCAFTTLAQGNLPFETAILSAIARHGGGGFGVYCTVVESHPVFVGDTVDLL